MTYIRLCKHANYAVSRFLIKAERKPQKGKALLIEKKLSSSPFFKLGASRSPSNKLPEPSVAIFLPGAKAAHVSLAKTHGKRNKLFYSYLKVPLFGVSNLLIRF